MVPNELYIYIYMYMFTCISFAHLKNETPLGQVIAVHSCWGSAGVYVVRKKSLGAVARCERNKLFKKCLYEGCRKYLVQVTDRVELLCCM